MRDNEWMVRHGQAVVNPTDTERPIVDIITALSLYIGNVESKFGPPFEDYFLGEGVGQIIEGVRTLLNGDIGRLDAGTCDMLLGDLARRAGWDLNRSEYVGHQS